MRLSASDWGKYVEKLSRINAEAGKQMQAFIDRNGTDDTSALVRYAYALATKYGEASGSLACEMYDAIAEKSGKRVEAAEMAETATYQETARAVQGTMINRRNSVPQTVERLVKQTSADTMLKNALRDGAKFAWIPHGDTCAFCIAIASRGWQYMSKSALKNGHAEHIHANCDCEYVISFDANPQVEGYNPDKYKKMYYDADGRTPKAKINAMRRKMYAKEKEEKASENRPNIPEFTPAKNRADAESFAKKFANSVNYSGISIDNANIINDQLNTLTAKYPIKPLEEITNKSRAVMSASHKTLNISGNKLGKVLTESPKVFAAQQAERKQQVQDYIDRWAGKNMPNTFKQRIEKLEGLLKFKRYGVLESYDDKVRCCVTHEYGHIISDQYFGMINDERANPNYRTNWGLRGMVTNWEDAFRTARKTGDIYKLSEYANTNVDEFFAECFTAYEMGEKLPDYIESLMRKVLKNGIM